eukprot:64764-Prymnesium_polylepis.1
MISKGRIFVLITHWRYAPISCSDERSELTPRRRYARILSAVGCLCLWGPGATSCDSTPCELAPQRAAAARADAPESVAAYRGCRW